MKISELDETLRDEFHIGDFASEKVEGGYRLKIFQGENNGQRFWEYITDNILNGDDQLTWQGGLFFIDPVNQGRKDEGSIQ